MKLHILKAFVIRFSVRSSRDCRIQPAQGPLGRVQGDDKLAAKG